MHLNFVCKYIFTPGIFSPLLIILFLQKPVTLNAQSLTNLEILYSLTDSLVNKIADEIPHDQNKILLKLNLGTAYSLFENNIRTGFIKKGIEIQVHAENENIIPSVNIILEKAGIEYGEMWRKGWFGAHYLPRRAMISGNYLQSFSDNEIRTFEITALDTIKVDDIKMLENESFPFTQDEIPSEPFFFGVAEPVLAIAAAAAIVILFFSIRSK
jgi:hypothetical protein